MVKEEPTTSNLVADCDINSNRRVGADCVGIITRTKNRPVLLERSIQSVLSQTHENWIHIIVNDGGDRNSLDVILNKYVCRYLGRLTFIDNNEAIGAVPSLNVGLRACRSDYVVTHDDDDTWEPAFLGRCISALKLRKRLIPTTRGIICHATAIVEKVEGDSVFERYRYSHNGWVRSVTLIGLAAENFIPPISFVYEREVLSEIGFFNDYKFADDWEFYLRFLSKFDIAVLPEHLANWHLRPDATTAYGNTVDVDRVNEHPAIVAALINDLIRRDLESGKFGLGFLVALANRSRLSANLKHEIWGASHRLYGRLKIRKLAGRRYQGAFEADSGVQPA